MKRLIILAAMLLATGAMAQQSRPDGLLACDPCFPALDSPVVDAAHMLSEESKSELANWLGRLANGELGDGKKVQLVIATIPSLQGYDEKDFGWQLFDYWRIGQGYKNWAILVVVVMDEENQWYTQAYPAAAFDNQGWRATFNMVINCEMRRHFLAGDFEGGITKAMYALGKALTGGGYSHLGPCG